MSPMTCDFSRMMYRKHSTAIKAFFCAIIMWEKKMNCLLKTWLINVETKYSCRNPFPLRTKSQVLEFVVCFFLQANNSLASMLSATLLICINLCDLSPMRAKRRWGRSEAVGSALFVLCVCVKWRDLGLLSFCHRLRFEDKMDGWPRLAPSSQATSHSGPPQRNNLTFAVMRGEECVTAWLFGKIMCCEMSPKKKDQC